MPWYTPLNVYLQTILGFWILLLKVKVKRLFHLLTLNHYMCIYRRKKYDPSTPSIHILSDRCWLTNGHFSLNPFASPSSTLLMFECRVPVCFCVFSDVNVSFMNWGIDPRDFFIFGLHVFVQTDWILCIRNMQTFSIKFRGDLTFIPQQEDNGFTFICQ